MKKLLLTLAVVALAAVAQAGGKDCPSNKNAAACPAGKTVSADKKAACPAEKAKADSCCSGSVAKKALLSPKAADAKT